MQVRRHLQRLILRSVEMFLLLMPRSFEVFSPACGCPFLLFHKLEHTYYPDQLKFFPLLAGWYIPSYCKMESSIDQERKFSSSFWYSISFHLNGSNLRFSLVRFKKFE